MKKIDIDINKFAEKFAEVYDKLSHSNDYIPFFGMIANDFERCIEYNPAFKAFVNEFYELRGRPITDDLEAVAFMYAIDEMYKA